jgi:hypothetical protein
MLSFQLSKVLSDHLTEIKDLSELVVSLEEIEKIQGIIEQYSLLIAKGGQELAGNAGQMHSELANARRLVAAISPRKFFSEIGTLLEVLKKIDAVNPLPGGIVRELLEDLETFTDVFDLFIREQNAVNLTPLIFQASALGNRLRSWRGTIEFIYRLVEPEEPQLSSSGSFTLLLPSQLSFREFVDRLKALEEIYSELCQLLGFSEVEYPLQISKIESGSLWASVFGNSTVLKLIDDFLRNAASYIHRNHTAEGKLAAIPSKLETLDQILNFSEKLKAAGMDSSEMHEEIVKGGVVIAKDLNRLLSGQKSITVNSNTIVLSSLTQTQLNYTEMKRIENSGVPRLPDVE